jgi:hypothetical protein
MAETVFPLMTAGRPRSSTKIAVLAGAGWGRSLAKLAQRLQPGDGDGKPVGLVAVDEADATIGIAHVVFHCSTWSATWHCYLEDLFVDPDRCGRGAGAVR